MIKFNKVYLILSVILFVSEIITGLYMHDAVMRPYGGDFLVVILLYCLVKSFTETPVVKTAVGVLLFSYAIEISQYFHTERLLGLQRSKIALLLLGSRFSFTDLLSYTLGILTVIAIERMRNHPVMSLKNRR